MLKAQIADFLSKELRLDKNEVLKSLEKPKYSNLGDVSFPCFNLAKEFKKSPYAISNELAQKFLALPQGISKVQALGGYINFFYDKKVLALEILPKILSERRKYGSSKIGKGKCIVIDYSSPNIAKPMSIGHLRSTIIGNSLYRIFSFQGYKCVGINYLGDYGTQFGKILCAYELWGRLLGSDLKNKPIESMLKLYIRFTEEAEKNPALEDEARAWFKRLEEKDPRAIELWKQFRELSIKDFKKFYEILGVNFDVYSGESQFMEKAKEVIEELKNKKIAIESEGAWMIPFENEAPLLIQKKDGTSLYSTRDIASAREHQKKYHFYKKLYVVATEQNLYFRHLFETLKKMGYGWAEGCVHVPFGMIYMPDGKISTRKGNIIFLEDVLEKIFELTRGIIKDSKYPEKEKDKIAKAVGISALIYSDLSNDKVRDIKFDWNTILRLDGDSGPYIQYTCARANSIIRKMKKEKTSKGMPEFLTPEEETLISDLSEFPGIVLDSSGHYAPHIIANYLLRISDHFNSFYEKCPVMNSRKDEKDFRIELTKAVSQVLENGMVLLGMIPLKRM